MLKQVDNGRFQPINRGYSSVFRLNRLSLGLVVPLKAYTHGPVPSMTRHVERVHLAEKLGPAAVSRIRIGSRGTGMAGSTILAESLRRHESSATGGRASRQLAAQQNQRCSRFTSI